MTICVLLFCGNPPAEISLIYSVLENEVIL
jgi:hypothetical protein